MTTTNPQGQNAMTNTTKDLPELPMGETVSVKGDQCIHHFTADQMRAYARAALAEAAPTTAYQQANPLGGPAKVFDAMAAAIRAGDDYHAVMRTYGFSEAAPAEVVDIIELMRQCGGRGTKRSDADGERLIVSGSDLKRFLKACAPTAPVAGVEAVSDMLSVLSCIRKDVAASKFGGLRCDELERQIRALASHTAPADPDSRPFCECVNCANGMGICQTVDESDPSDVAVAVVGEPSKYQRMFEAACVDLGLINEALGLDPNDGGAEPILDAIKELQGLAAQPSPPAPQEDAALDAVRECRMLTMDELAEIAESYQTSDAAMMYDAIRKFREVNNLTIAAQKEQS